MDKSKRGGVWESSCLLLLFLYCLTCQQFQYVDSVPEEDYAMLLENQGFNEPATDSRSKLVSSLSHLLEQDEEDKRSSSFFPLRGKKMTNSDPNNPDPYQFMPEHDDKRSQFFPLRGKKIPSELKRASYFMPMRGRKNDEWDEAEEEGEDDMDKRASSFMPMRGKKKINLAPSTFQHYGKSGTYPNIKTDISFASSSDSNRVSDKRMSSFIPVRGRKSSLEDVRTGDGDVKPNSSMNEEKNETHTERSKRSISFTPMRGRRLLSRDQEQTAVNSSPDNALSNFLEKKYYSFMPMRGRRTGESNENLPFIFSSNMDNFRIESQANELPDTTVNENFSKRTLAFMPMRGKKDLFDSKELYDTSYPVVEEISSEDKKSSPFMAMRGRRDVLPDTNVDTDFTDTSESKRASSFMPMRGRREFEADDLNKSSFFKNSPNSHLENMKDEFDFISNASLKNFSDDFMKRLTFMPSGYQRTPNTGDFYRTDKKYFGFMPMRGRRFNELNNINDIDLTGIRDSDDKRASSFMPMRGRRSSSENGLSNYYYSPFPYFIPAGIGSALISRPFGGSDMFLGSIREAAIKNRRVYDWDSVKRAFHASRGKRIGEDALSANAENHVQTEELTEDRNTPDRDLLKSFRYKRNILRPQVSFKPQRTYLALKRPMSFFATRGKRMDRSTISKLP